MKLNINNKYFRWGLTAFLTVDACILFYYLLFHSSNIKSVLQSIINILMPVVWGFAIAYLLTPVINFIENKILIPFCTKCRIKESKKRNSLIRGITILVTAFLFIMLIYLLAYMLLSQIIPSVQNIINNFDKYTDNFTNWLNRIMDNNNPEYGDSILWLIDTYSVQLVDWLNSLMPDPGQLIKTVSLSVISVFSYLWDFIIGFIISIYVLASKEKFAGQAKKLAYAIWETDSANRIISNFRFTHNTFIGFLGGKIVDSIIIGLLCFIGTTILQTPYSALVSVVIGVTNIIPFFGPFLGAVPCTVLIFIVDPIHPLNCLYFVIFILILQQIDGNFIGPKILGSSTGLSGFWVIFSITLAGGLLGVVGMIVGVPIFAVFYAAIKSIVDSMLEKKNMPVESKRYEKTEFVDEKGFHDIQKATKSTTKTKHTFRLKLQEIKKDKEERKDK